MKITVLFFAMCFVFAPSSSQKIKNDFFALHNIIRGDSTYDTFDKQVYLLKSAGYDGIEINLVESFEGMEAALVNHHFKASFFYVRVTLDEPYFEERLQTCIEQLKGTKTIIAPFIVGNARFPRGSHEADTLVVQLMRRLSGWAGASGLQVAIYPHLGYYVERTDHAVGLVKLIDRKNVGLTFNLCHWLATTTLPERSNLRAQLKEMQPYLKMITISGANDVVSQQQNVWNDYILPLGTGSFDTYELLKYCLKNLQLKIPVGVQCYNIKTVKYRLVQNTMQVWKQYKQRLEKEK